jgi:hypothetical protein
MVKTLKTLKMLTTLVMTLLLAAPAETVWAQTTPDAEVWRTFASRLDVGSRVKLRLRNGQRVSATLIQAGPDDIVIQPRTRTPVAMQHVPYEAIVLLERDDAQGIGVGKAVAIGVAAGTATFLGILLFIVASID